MTEKSTEPASAPTIKTGALRPADLTSPPDANLPGKASEPDELLKKVAEEAKRSDDVVVQIQSPGDKGELVTEVHNLVDAD